MIFGRSASARSRTSSKSMRPVSARTPYWTEWNHLPVAETFHLTHGWKVSATGKWFHSVQYGVRADTGRIDFDEVRDLALAERPKIIYCGGTAIPRTIDFPAFAAIAGEVGAILVADIAHIAGLI